MHKNLQKMQTPQQNFSKKLVWAFKNAGFYDDSKFVERGSTNVRKKVNCNKKEKIIIII
jgi:hypothetical protein